MKKDWSEQYQQPKKKNVEDLSTAELEQHTEDVREIIRSVLTCGSLQESQKTVESIHRGILYMPLDDELFVNKIIKHLDTGGELKSLIQEVLENPVKKPIHTQKDIEEYLSPKEIIVLAGIKRRSKILQHKVKKYVKNYFSTQN